MHTRIEIPEIYRDVNFINPTLGSLSVGKMLHNITSFVKIQPESYYRLVIGTDSQVKHLNGTAECDYVTAIVIHRIGNGGRYYWRKERMFTKPVLRQKIYEETTRSLMTAHSLVPSLRSVVSPAKYSLEIHIDVGTNGPTREMIKEVVGMVTGNGFVAKTKPESWAASSVADRYT